MSQEKQQSERIFGLDVVRALAISMVLFSHIYYLIDSTNPMFISLSGLFGFAGVELFFVLSGFLIGGIVLKLYLSNAFTISTIFNFLRRRWMRTLPNYYLVLVLNILVGLSIGYSMKEVWRYFFFIQNFSTYHLTFFSESWSLSIEEWTYLITPFLFFLSFKVFKNKKNGFIITTVLVISIFHFLRYSLSQNHLIINMKQWNEEVKSLVIYRIDVILMGFILAWMNYFYQNSLKKYSVYLFIVAVHLFFLQFVAMNVMGFDIVSSPNYFIIFYFTLSSVTFAFTLPVFIFWVSSKGFLSKIINGVSKLSYSVYLVHYSLVTVLFKYLKVNYLQDIPSLLLIMIYLFIVFLVAYMLYHFIEKPIMQKR